MCTVLVAPAARSPNEQLSTCGAEPAIEQSGLSGLSDQVTPEPEPAGRLSLKVTPVAVPVPVFETVIVNPIGSPAFTEAASAVFEIVRFAGLHVIDASSDGFPSFVEWAVAVLS